MEAVVPLATAARPLFATSTMMSGVPVLRTTASAYGARLLSVGTIGAALTSTATTYFAAPTVTPGLPTATTTATPAIPIATMATVGSEHLIPAPGTSER